jgi:hypothetical protein
MAVVDRVEEFSQIDVDDPVASQLHRVLPEGIQSSVGTASGPKAVRDVQEVRLVDGFQHHQHRTLEDLILVRGYPQRPRLARRAGLGDLDSTHRRCHVRAGLGAVEQVLKVGHQVRLIVFRGLSVYADGAVFAGSEIGRVQPLDVDVMRQVRERHVRAVPGEFRDPFLFR